MQAVLGGQIKPGDVVVIRYEGPRGGPGMREMLSTTAALTGRGVRTRSSVMPTSRRHFSVRGGERARCARVTS